MQSRTRFKPTSPAAMAIPKRPLRPLPRSTASTLRRCGKLSPGPAVLKTSSVIMPSTLSSPAASKIGGVSCRQKIAGTPDNVSGHFYSSRIRKDDTMTDDEVQPWIGKPVRVTLADASIIAGTLHGEDGHGHGHKHYTVV